MGETSERAIVFYGRAGENTTNINETDGHERLQPKSPITTDVPGTRAFFRSVIV